MRVDAKLKNVRLAAQKGRLVADQIRGLPVERALQLLTFSPKKAARTIKKVLESAIANAEHNEGADVDELKVAAIFYDYTSEHGLVMMDRSTFLNLFGDHTINSLAIFFDPQEPRRPQLIQEIRRRAEERGLPVQTQAQLHDNILKVFDNTFAVTRSMRVMAIVVAFFGIAGALLTLFMERRREFGIYRSLGFSTGQIARMTLLEGLGMGMVSYVLSTLVGTTLAFLLIRVINLRSFNWTIFFYPALEPYVWTALTAVAASLGAAAYPIWKVCRTYPQMQIREE